MKSSKRRAAIKPMALSEMEMAVKHFHEAKRRISKTRALRSIEASLEKGIAKAFARQGKLFVAKFAALKPQWPMQESYFNVKLFTDFSEAVSAGELDPLFDAVELETMELLVEPISDAAKASLDAGAKALIATLNVSASFDLGNPRAAAYLDEHGAALVKNINETTREGIQGLVQRAMDDGWSYSKTAEEIQRRYMEFAIGKPQEHIDSRAHLVAVTEAGMAYEEGSFAVIEDLRDGGLEMEKYWSTVGDDRVSDECRQNEADGWIPVDQAHSSGDMHPLRFPGCRCDELYQAKV